MRPRVGHTMVVVLYAIGIAFGASGCALMSKGELVDIRYFTPERVDPQRNSQLPGARSLAPAPDGPIQVRLGRVSSGQNLRERIAYRDNAFERWYYDDLRWTERPEIYVRRELGRSLFEARGLHRVLDGTAPTLDVEVIAFDELRLAKRRAVRIQLKVMLYEEGGVIFEDTLTTDRGVAGDKPNMEAIIAAMATALDEAADQVTHTVEKALVERQSASRTDSARKESVVRVAPVGFAQ